MIGDQAGISGEFTFAPVGTVAAHAVLLASPWTSGLSAEELAVTNKAIEERTPSGVFEKYRHAEVATKPKEQGTEPDMDRNARRAAFSNLMSRSI